MRGGWLHTGDAAIMDDDGLIYIVDRLKDMIISGGENVYSTEVENAISVMPEIAEVSVIGIPDPKWGEAVHAIVVPRNGATVTPEAVQAHCRKLIAGYKCPRSVELRSEPLPVSAAGKIQKNVLREPYWREPGKAGELTAIDAPRNKNDSRGKKIREVNMSETPITPPARVGFFGLGAMGCGMAVNLVKAGFTVSAYDPSADARKNFESRSGAKAVATAREACENQDAIVTMLGDGKIVRAALLGGDAPITAAKKGTLVIDCSSSSPPDTLSLGTDLAQHGLGLIDSPGLRRAKRRG